MFLYISLQGTKLVQINEKLGLISRVANSSSRTFNPLGADSEPSWLILSSRLTTSSDAEKPTNLFVDLVC